jgi:DNA-binding transcriptional LysR family regulator
MDLNGVNLNLLMALDALMTERHVGRAARRVGVTQSAMSHNLRQLRELLEDRLLVRSGNQMMPTARAVALAPVLREGLRSLEQVLHTPDSPDPQTFTRTFTVSLQDTIAAGLLPPILERMRHEAPQARLKIMPPGGPELAELMARGELDAALFLPFEVPAGVSTGTALKASGWSAMVREDHPVLDSGLDLDAYCALPHAITTISDDTPSLVDHILADLGRSRFVALRVPYNLALPGALASTDLITTLPTPAVRMHEARWPVRGAPLPIEMPLSEVLLGWHERYDTDPAHRWFRELLMDGCRQMSRQYAL